MPAANSYLEWFAGGNLPRKRASICVRPVLKKTLSVTVSTDSEDPENTEKCKCKKVHFADEAKAAKSAMKKKAGTEKDKENPTEKPTDVDCTSFCKGCKKVAAGEESKKEYQGVKHEIGSNIHNCGNCHNCGSTPGCWNAYVKSCCDGNPKISQQQNQNQNQSRNNDNVKQNWNSDNNNNSKYNNNNTRQTWDTNNASTFNSNHQDRSLNTQTRHQSQNSAINTLTDFVQRNMSRLIQPSRSEVIIREDVIESPSDPRPNAFFDARTGILRIYHGPIYGNPYVTLVPLNPSISMGTPGPGFGALRGSGGPGPFGGSALLFPPFLAGGNGPPDGQARNNSIQGNLGNGGGNEGGGNSGNNFSHNNSTSNRVGWSNPSDASKAGHRGGWRGSSSSDQNNNNNNNSPSNNNESWGNKTNSSIPTANDTSTSTWGDSATNANKGSNSNSGRNLDHSNGNWNSNNNNSSSSNWGNSKGYSSNNPVEGGWGGDYPNNENSSSTENAWGNSNFNSNNNSNNKASSSHGWGGASGNDNSNSNSNDWGNPNSNGNNASNSNPSWGNSNKVTAEGNETNLSGGSWANGGSGPTGISGGGIDNWTTGGNDNSDNDIWGKPSEQAAWGDQNAAAGNNEPKVGW